MRRSAKVTGATTRTHTTCCDKRLVVAMGRAAPKRAGGGAPALCVSGAVANAAGLPVVLFARRQLAHVDPGDGCGVVLQLFEREIKVVLAG